MFYPLLCYASFKVCLLLALPFRLPTLIACFMEIIGLDCLGIRPGVSYLRIDTSVDCNEKYYAQFRVVCFFFVLCYLSVPFIWYALLYRLRDRLVVGVDPGYTQDARKNAIRARKSDGGLKAYAFLFHVCKYMFSLLCTRVLCVHSPHSSQFLRSTRVLLFRVG